MILHHRIAWFISKIQGKISHYFWQISDLLRRCVFHTSLVSEIDKKCPLYPTTSFCPYPQLNGMAAHQLLYNRLVADAPCMVARFGSIEMAMLTNIYFALQKKPLICKYKDFLLGKNNGDFVFKKLIANSMKENAGFFPDTQTNLEHWYHLCLKDMTECDILASWWNYERIFKEHLTNIKRIGLQDLNETILSQSFVWTSALKGKKVLVIHPFQKSIEAQYQHREKLFPYNSEILPEFELQTIKAVQSIANEKSEFASWFVALDYMKDEINQRDFDIALIGCGAYGFNLAAHVKRIGKKSVHMGGPLQTLFGIKGKRWREMPNFSTLFNQYWVDPLPEEYPKNFQTVEYGGCYW